MGPAVGKTHKPHTHPLHEPATASRLHPRPQARKAPHMGTRAPNDPRNTGNRPAAPRRRLPSAQPPHTHNLRLPKLPNHIHHPNTQKPPRHHPLPKLPLPGSSRTSQSNSPHTSSHKTAPNPSSSPRPHPHKPRNPHRESRYLQSHTKKPHTPHRKRRRDPHNDPSTHRLPRHTRAQKLGPTVRKFRIVHT